MGSTTRTEGLDRMKARAASIAHAAKDRLNRAAYENNEAFYGKVKSVIPEKDGQLGGTLQQGETDLGYFTTVGGEAAPYPLHLDAGHIDRGGKHVPGKPFWFTSRRALKNSFRSKNVTAVNQALKAGS